MFCVLSKHMRKITHGIIINPWNADLFMESLFIDLFKCSLHVFTINGIIC